GLTPDEGAAKLRAIRIAAKSLGLPELRSGRLRAGPAPDSLVRADVPARLFRRLARRAPSREARRRPGHARAGGRRRLLLGARRDRRRTRRLHAALQLRRAARGSVELVRD